MLKFSVLIVLVFFVGGAFAVSGVPEGSGTVEHPYQIADYEDLKVIKDSLSAHYLLVNNINASASKIENNEQGFEPIGTDGKPFTGKVNGSGYVISGLYINRLSDYVGLFGKIENATIESLGILGNVSGDAYVGMLVGQVGESSIIKDSYSGGIVSGGYVLGGLVGKNLGRIITSYSTASVQGGIGIQGGNGIGGLVGYNESYIYGCYSIGFVEGISNVGGLAGYTSRDGWVTSSYWNVDVSGQNTSDGGTGLTTSQMLDSNSYSSWDFENSWEIINGQTYPGLQNMDDATFAIADSYHAIPNDFNFDQFLSNDLDVESGISGATVSTFADITQYNTIRDSLYVYYYIGTIMPNTDTVLSGIAYVAVPNDTISIETYEELKLIGNHDDYPLYGCYKLLKDIDASASRGENGDAGFIPIGDTANAFTGIFDGDSHVIYGLFIHRPKSSNVGLFGVVRSGTIQNLGVKGEIRGGKYVGTIAGQITQSTIVTKSYGIAIVEGWSYIGGLVGYSTWESSITRSYSSGQVSGYEHVGGLLGEIDYGSGIYNSYSTAGIAGIRKTGGLIGSSSNIDKWYTIINCYSAGITINNNFGIGLGIGTNRRNQTVEGNYWNVETLGRSSYSYATALSNKQMKKSSSFYEWDFKTIWEIREEQTYPGLRGVDDMQFGMPDSFDSLPAPQDYEIFLANDMDVDSGDSSITVFKKTNFFRYNSSKDSIYIIYFPGVAGSLNDTTWAGPSYISVPLDTIKLASYEELKKVGNESDYPLYWNYVLTNDINASNSRTENVGKGFDPIGGNETPFSGTFDGGGHVIYGLYINRPDEELNGLFGKVVGGAIRNVGVSGEMIAGEYTGLLVGYLHDGATIQNSYTTGTIDAGSYTGGLVGMFKENSNIVNCYSTADVSGETRVGGLGGEQSGGRHKQSYSTGSVKGVWGIGGLVGTNNDYSKPIDIYWDINTSGQTYSEGGEGKITDSMKDRSMYSGWSFDSIWTILEDKSYPGLMMVNNAPMAFRDSTEMATTIALSQLLLNDYDIERYQEQLVVKVDSVYGIGTTDSLTLFSFPAGTVAGVIDSIRYRVGEVLTDGDTLWGNYATALLQQSLANLAPVAEKDEITLAEDSDVTIDLNTLILNDIDSPIETLTFDSIITESVRIGSVVINGTQMNYVPAENWNGLDTVEYVMSDGVFHDTGYVVLTVTPVNDAPVLIAINPQVIKEDSLIIIVDTMVQASDIDGDSWSYLIEEQSGYSVSNNVITLDKNINGDLLIPISIFDGQAESEKRTLQLTISPVNDAPEIISVIPQTIAEDSALTFLSAMVQTNDVEGNTVNIVLDSGMNYSIIKGTVIPDQDFNGTLQVSIRASDGSDMSEEKTLELTVFAVNDMPQLTIINAQVINEGESLLVDHSLTDALDVDNDTLTYIFESDSNYTVVNNTIIPLANFNGILIIPVRVTDGTDTTTSVNMVLTVTSVNDAPALSMVSPATIEQREKLTIDLLMTDAYDIDNDTLVLIVERGDDYLVVSGNKVSPNRDFIGTLSVPISVTDGIDTSASITMLIEVVPNAVISSNEDVLQLSSFEQYYSSKLPMSSEPNSLPMSSESNSQPISSESIFIDSITISSIEQVGEIGQSSSSENVLSVQNSTINIYSGNNNGVSGMVIWNTGSGNLIIPGPEAAMSFRVYNVHGEFIESGSLQDGLAYVSEYAPQGTLFIKFK